MNISLEDVCHVDEPKTQEMYHFAMNGKSFAVIAEHFPDVLQKVRDLQTENKTYTSVVIGAETCCTMGAIIYMIPGCGCVFFPVACAAWDRICQDGA